MRYLLIFWALPLGLFWGWYFLSYNDINFGFLFLSRLVHDFTFQMYGNLIGVDPEAIPGLVAKACVFDTLFILAILAFRRRRAIMQWTAGRWSRYFGGRPAPAILSRSSTP